MDDQEFCKLSCEAFCEQLASKAPVPGGGGASALAGALAVSLGNMVGNLTVGKKKYAEVEDEMRALNTKAESLRGELLHLVQRDADGFAPLAAVYQMPSGTAEEKAEKEKRLQEELVNACEVPRAIMMSCGQSLELIDVYAEKGSVMALSDAAAAALLCGAALEAASLNIRINAKSLRDRKKAEDLLRWTDAAVKTGKQRADSIYSRALERLK